MRKIDQKTMDYRKYWNRLYRRLELWLRWKYEKGVTGNIGLHDYDEWRQLINTNPEMWDALKKIVPNTIDVVEDFLSTEDVVRKLYRATESRTASRVQSFNYNFDEKSVKLNLVVDGILAECAKMYPDKYERMREIEREYREKWKVPEEEIREMGRLKRELLEECIEPLTRQRMREVMKEVFGEDRKFSLECTSAIFPEIRYYCEVKTHV